MRLQMARHATIVRREVVTAEVSFEYLPAYHKLDEEGQAEVRDAVAKLDPTTLALNSRDGELYLLDIWLSLYVQPHHNWPGSWQYDGGEVTTLQEVYESRVETV